ncbi:hypothetical protein ACFQPA_03480 [Halomarina halobia]|uniref:Uncharacterized protein n=1 Tax=Halomarina halobia TaxID=3033386 RepID=A0ABD6A544_9EURY|nr:hypothetical protein [Halomarina sp. PSR21]
MSTRTHDETNQPSDTPDTLELDCVALPLDDGQVILYDPSNHHAWIQSDTAVELEGDPPSDG